LSKVITSSEAQLSNESFLAKAPEKVLNTMREKLADYKAQLAKSQEALHEL
jgi:valyl-tRNA synthetase